MARQNNVFLYGFIESKPKIMINMEKFLKENLPYKYEDEKEAIIAEILKGYSVINKLPVQD